MRKAMQEVVASTITGHADTALLLVDIGVWPFRDLLKQYPERVKNIGIFEPGTISIAAGLSLSGITPVVYGISPFIVQRALEQLKLDFIYQNTGGNFITTGASYDFSTLGYSHYCPEDVATLYQLPGMEIITPGTPDQFRKLWGVYALDGRASYFRMTDYCNKKEVDVEPGKAVVLKKGSKGMVIAVAETLDPVWSAVQDEDVTVLYFTTVQPFDSAALQKLYTPNIFVCSPFYEGTFAPLIVSALQGQKILIREIGVPRKVLRNYGTFQEKNDYCGLTAEKIRVEIKNFLEDPTP